MRPPRGFTQKEAKWDHCAQQPPAIELAISVVKGIDPVRSLYQLIDVQRLLSPRRVTLQVAPKAVSWGVTASKAVVQISVAWRSSSFPSDRDDAFTSKRHMSIATSH